MRKGGKLITNGVSFLRKIKPQQYKEDKAVFR